jgi:hypothetical protein
VRQSAFRRAEECGGPYVMLALLMIDEPGLRAHTAWVGCRVADEPVCFGTSSSHDYTT